MRQTEKSSPIGLFITFLTVGLYVISAGILAIIAAALLFEGIESTLFALSGGVLADSSTEIFGFLFHAATAIALLETIEVYFRSHRFAVEALFLAGIAEVVRHILIYDLQNIPEGDLLTSGILLGGLIAGILVTRLVQNRNVRKDRKSRSRSSVQNQGFLQRITTSMW
jgi:uncharacterized membrane protein (DUF373 family)